MAASLLTKEKVILTNVPKITAWCEGYDNDLRGVRGSCTAWWLEQI
jgi:hypothetical protein